MFFNNEKENLKKQIKNMEKTMKFNEIELQVLSIMQTMEILINLKMLEEEKVLDYGFYHLEAIINFISKNRFKLTGFKINPVKMEQYVKDFYEISFILLQMSKHEIDTKEVSRYIFSAIKKIEEYASPSPEFNYNIAEFDKNY